MPSSRFLIFFSFILCVISGATQINTTTEEQGKVPQQQEKQPDKQQQPAVVHNVPEEKEPHGAANDNQKVEEQLPEQQQQQPVDVDVNQVEGKDDNHAAAAAAAGPGGKKKPLSFEEFDKLSLEEMKEHLGEHGELLGDFKDSFDPYKDDEEHHGDRDDEFRDREFINSEEHELGEYDFDYSEGLSLLIHEGGMDCFYEDVKEKDDHVSGAFVVSAAEAKIDFTIKDPTGMIVLRRYGEAEDEYNVQETQIGLYELCFSNINYSGDKMVTHVTHKLKSQHPVEKQHVSHLSQYARHLDVKMGEFESEQRLLQIRTDRHMKTEESTNERVAYYSTFELVTYILVSVLQVVYIKHLLDGPTRGSGGPRSWA